MNNFKKQISIALIFTSLSTSLVAQQLNNAPKEFAATAVGYGFQERSSNNEQRELPDKELKSKEVSIEVAANKSADIFLDNTSRTIEIKTWDQSKVKIVTTIYYEGDATKLSDEEWFEKLNISLKPLGNSIRIKSSTVSSGSYSYGNNTYGWSSTNGVAIFNSEVDNERTKSNSKRIVTIYIPKDNKLDIESKYSDVALLNNVNKLNVDITNGSLELQDVNTLQVRSKYASVTVGNIKSGEIDFMNGRFSAKDADDLDIDTKYATIELGNVKRLTTRSTNDEYEIDQVGTFTGRKNYGNLRINTLSNALELDGTNADIKIRNIASSVDNINIDNKYADIRLPLKNIKNYTVNFNGPYSNVYANFEKKPFSGTQTTTSKKDGLTETIRSIQRSVSMANSDDDCNCKDKFSAVGGDGKSTKIEMKCQNCTVDFK